MEPLDPGQIADLLAVGPTILDAELRAAGEALASWPAPGEWSMKACVGHLIEAERRGFAGRIRIILADDRPALITWDEPSVALARRDEERRMDELLTEFAELRTTSVELIRSLRPSGLDRIGRHPFAGDLAVRDVLAEWPHHDRNHIRQVLAVVQARVYDQLGSARRFVDDE